MSFSFFGLTFYLYGLIAGVAVAVGFFLAEYQAKKISMEPTLFWRIAWAAVLGGLLGARMYHVLTDWSMYQENIFLIPQLWNGGLSIIGAFLGGGLGVWATLVWMGHKSSLGSAADIAALCLPIAQAIGRVGNYVNQELYGIPTQLPWGIFIEPQHRLQPYQNQESFHPLFAYESLGMITFAFICWWLEHKKIWQVGSGKYALFYLSVYGIFRGLLEFIRIDKARFLNTSLGLNQVLLFICGGVALFLLGQKLLETSVNRKKLSRLGIFIGACVMLSGCVPLGQPKKELLSLPDKTLVAVRLVRQQAEPLNLTVELVNTDQSRAQGLSGRSSIGSDGMLFAFPQPSQHLFWMKDMKFNIDIIWINQGKIIDITREVPVPTVEEVATQRLKTFHPSSPASVVLEVPAGTAKSWQLQTGDTFELP